MSNDQIYPTYTVFISESTKLNQIFVVLSEIKYKLYFEFGKYGFVSKLNKLL